jgi:hypothetical protein
VLDGLVRTPNDWTGPEAVDGKPFVLDTVTDRIGGKASGSAG